MLNLTELPAQITTGVFRWKIVSTYLVPGATAPLLAPAQGQIVFEPMLDVVNIDGTEQASAVYTPKTVDLDADGYMEVTLPADTDGRGWDYRITPKLRLASGPDAYVPATGTIAQPFGAHLSPGAVVDLDDIRPIGKIASTGVLVSQGKAGVSVVDATQLTPTTFVLNLSDGTTSSVITLPVVTASGTAVPAVDTTAPTTVTA